MEKHYLCAKEKAHMGNKIYHVEFKMPKAGRRTHHYFGSKAAIYEVFGKEDLGIMYRALLNRRIDEDTPFENSRCIIRLGELHRKETNRMRKVPKQTTKRIIWKNEEQ